MPYSIELAINGLFVLYISLSRAENLPQFVGGLNSSVVYQLFTYIAPLCVLITTLFHFKRSAGIDEFIRKYIFSFVIFVPMVITYGDVEFLYWLTVVHLFSTFISLYDGADTRKDSLEVGWMQKLRLKPAQLVVFSFGAIIVAGTLLLALPISAAEGVKIGFIDALFMASSATCVTGLSTISLADDLSLFGQVVILVLFQVGGLGIMTLSSCLAVLMGRSLGVKEQVMMQDVLDSSSASELMRLIIDIVKFTLSIELIGGIVLTLGFYLEDFEIGNALFLGFYHSVSAFCNAGFSLFNASFVEYAYNPVISMTIVVLIITGGLGFSVIQEVFDGVKQRKKIVNYSLHSKIVVTTNFFLVVAGAVFLFLSEFLHSFEKLNLLEIFQVSLFQSVTLRTAGFNTVELSSLHPHTLYFMILFMFIGASPGSTGGGIKTTTFAVLIQSIMSTLRNKTKVGMFERTIPDTIVVRSIAIFVVSLITVSVMLLFMIKIEPQKDFLSITFETISAFATVGLSLGITSTLSFFGKVFIVFLMFVGRVGPLTLVLAVGQREGKKAGIEYPESKILIG